MNYGDRTPEEWRAAVAELVLGWARHARNTALYATDGDKHGLMTGGAVPISEFRPDLWADDARLVRDHVRDTWDVARKQRYREAVRRVLLGDKTDADWTFDFEPYMWASAALVVVENEE